MTSMTSKALMLSAYSILSLCVAEAAQVSPSTLDGGGQRVSSANYTMDGHFGAIVGLSTTAAPEQTARHGYVGQLTDVVDLALAGTPDTVDEEATTQLAGQAINDDTTITALSGSDVNWNPADWPLASIDASGLATADAVYEDTLALFSGAYLGHVGTGSVMVIDVDPDNFGSYAGDGLPDDWQVFYFGLDNPDAAPDADPTGTGQDNWFRYIAGLNPTNANELFTFRIARVPNETDQADLIYNPTRPGRQYTIRYTPDLIDPDWHVVAPAGAPITNVQEVTVRDLDASDTYKNYQILISLPEP